MPGKVQLIVLCVFPWLAFANSRGYFLWWVACTHALEMVVVLVTVLIMNFTIFVSDCELSHLTILNKTVFEKFSHCWNCSRKVLLQGLFCQLQNRGHGHGHDNDNSKNIKENMDMWTTTGHMEQTDQHLCDNMFKKWLPWTDPMAIRTNVKSRPRTGVNGPFYFDTKITSNRTLLFLDTERNIVLIIWNALGLNFLIY